MRRTPGFFLLHDPALALRLPLHFMFPQQGYLSALSKNHSAFTKGHVERGRALGVWSNPNIDQADSAGSICNKQVFRKLSDRRW